VPARRYLLRALPNALQALNFYSEAQREGYDTVTRSASCSSKGQGQPRCLYSPGCRQKLSEKSRMRLRWQP
jgi:hypothetical protein